MPHIGGHRSYSFLFHGYSLVEAALSQLGLAPPPCIGGPRPFLRVRASLHPPGSIVSILGLGTPLRRPTNALKIVLVSDHLALVSRGHSRRRFALRVAAETPTVQAFPGMDDRVGQKGYRPSKLVHVMSSDTASPAHRRDPNKQITLATTNVTLQHTFQHKRWSRAANEP